MFKIFKDQFNEAFIKFYFQAYLLMERSLRIRSKNKITIREMMLINLVDRLSETKHNTLSNLASYLQVSTPVVSVSVKSLIQKGYMSKKLNLDDNRIYHLQLTEKGKAHIKNSLAFSERLLKQGMKKLSPFDIAALKKAFEAAEIAIDLENQQLDLEENSVVKSVKPSE
jgi:DNA-binding MarR family transcriptional regulator